MTRHPFSRRVRRRKRSGVPPGARSPKDCNIKRRPSGRRGEIWKEKCGEDYLTLEFNELDEPLPTLATLATFRERYATLGEP